MEPSRWQQIEAILQAALDRSPAEREAFLAEACAGDEALLQAVEALLAREASAEFFIETSALKTVARDLVEEDFSGRRMERYQIIKPIGAGGMGKVYLAKDDNLGRQVAIKFLPESFIQAEALHRFEQEARAISKLNHPNIITIYEVAHHDHQPFIVTEFIAGHTLRSLLNESHLSVMRTVDLAVQMAAALEAAHSAGIVHRDIKPENIMVRADGWVKVLDFGIAKFNSKTDGMSDEAGEKLPTSLPSTELPVSPSLTLAGTVLGTTSYMSPEQFNGLSVDKRTDLYSLGLVLYEMFAGKRVALDGTRLPQLGNGLSNAPKALSAIISKALEPRREDRYDSATTMFADLRDLQKQMQTSKLRRQLWASVGTALVIAVSAFLLAQGEVWDEQKMYDGHTAAVRRAVFSPNGERLVSVSEDKQVIVWDFARRKRLMTFTDHTGWITSVAFSPDGKWFATGSYDNTVIVWDAKQLVKVAVLRGHQTDVHSVVFSPDSKWLASIEHGGVGTILWKVEGWIRTRDIATHSGGANILFSPDGRFLLAGHGQFECERGQMVYKLDDGIGWNGAAFSPDGKLFMRVPPNGNVDFWALAKPGEISNHKLLASFAAHQDFGRSAAFSPDGKLAATGSENVALWDVQTRKLLARFEYDSIVWSVAFSPDGQWLVTTHGDGSVLIWDVANRRREASLNGQANAVRAVAFSPDGKRFASAGDDRSVILWNAETGQKETVFTNHKTRVNAVAFSPNGQWLVSADQNGVIIRQDLNAPNCLWKTEAGEIPAQCLAVLPDGSRLVSSRGVFESERGCLAVNLGPPEEIAWSEGIALSRDGQLMASAGRNQAKAGLHLLNTNTWRRVAGVETGNIPLVSVSFSPDGRTLVTGSTDGTVLLWNVNPLRPLMTLGKHSARVKAVAFSPDGEFVASAGDDKQIALWDVGWRRNLPVNWFVRDVQIGTHTAPVLSLAFSPNGQQLVSGEHDKSVRLYTRRRTLFGWRRD